MRIPKFSGLDGLLRDVLVAASIITVFALSWSSLAQDASGARSPVRNYYPYILAYSYLLLLLPPVFAAKRAHTAISVVAGAILSALLAADLTALRFFDTPLAILYRHLPVTAGNASPAALAGYAVSYVPLGVWLLAAVAIFTGLGLARLARDRSRSRWTVLLMLPLSYAAAALATAASAPADPRLTALMNEQPTPLRHFKGTGGSGNFTMGNNPRAEPKTVILVIMESTGASTPSSRGGLLSHRLVEKSGTGGWVDFRNAVTNSNATDISVPSLLTGAGSHEPSAKVEALPVVSRYAAARGYRTALITSSTMRWAGFEALFRHSDMNRMATAEQSGLPFINDLAVDDHYVYRTAATEIAKADGKLFLTLYPQSLHWPFQTASAFPIPTGIKGRRARAAYIAETGFDLLFDSLRNTGRLEDALIIIAGDHGEFDYSATLRIPRMRMDTFDEGILSPIFLIKTSSSLSSTDVQTITENSGKLVANLDIAPTLADVLGATLKAPLSYSGHSLLQPIPDDRVAYSSSINQWRHWTSAAIAVSRGPDRMTCNRTDLCRLSTANGSELRYTRSAEPNDELFQLAMANPVLREALGQIHRNHYR